MMRSVRSNARKRSRRSRGALQAERRILLIRQHRVMLDHDLAALYGVEGRALNRAVKRNLVRFPADFMFQLTPLTPRAIRREGAGKRGVLRGGGRRVTPGP